MIRTALTLTLITMLALLLGCAGDTAPAPASDAGSGDARFQAGRHYHRIEPPLAAADNEVVEVFSYACPGCAAIQSEVDAFKRERGDSIRMTYAPAEFQPHWPPFARAFHTARELGAQGRLHRAFFDAIHQRRLPINGLEDLAGVAAGIGIDASRFLETARSPAVEQALQASRDFVRDSGTSSTPTFIVAGRYRVDTRQPVGNTALDVVGWLLDNAP